MTNETNKQAPKFEDLTPEQKAQVCFMNAAKRHKENKLDDALALYAQAVAYHPMMADAFNNMAVALRRKNHFEAALACYRRSLDIRDAHAGTYSNMGNVLNDLDLIDDAIAAHSMAVKLSPDDLLYQYNKALVLRDAGKFEEAITLFNQILAKDPHYKDCPWDRALTYLLAGDFKKGFAEYDARWSLEKSPPRKFDQPQWDGSPLVGRTLYIHREQGFGDALQFVRLVSLIKKYFGGIIILECQPELVTLFERVEGIDQLVPFGQKVPPFDVWIPLMSLARLLKIDQDHIGGSVPYLYPSDENRFRIRPSPKGGLNIGVVWAGSPTHQNDRRRSVKVEYFLPLVSHHDVTLFSLQKGPRAEDIILTGAQGLIVDAGKEIKDFNDTASLVSSMDLIISVDTSVVHLAAGMGKPVWLLLPYTPDWRWMWGREDSPWYPSLKIFRQEKAGDWEGVFKKVYLALEDKLLAQKIESEM
jgi:tetratricopeptide (TPR) repeat protein